MNRRIVYAGALAALLALTGCGDRAEAGEGSAEADSAAATAEPAAPSADTATGGEGSWRPPRRAIPTDSPAAGN